jgi:alkaline phosphatase D
VDTIDDESRTLLGDDQEAWLLDGLSNSTATWRLLGQQVVMTQMLAGTSPLNVDQWDGYAPARTRLLSHIQDQGIDNVVVLTGDIHSSWANDVPINIADYDEDTRAGSVVVEFVTPGVSSPGASILESVSSSNPNIRFLNGTENGYMIIDITASRVQADWYRCAPEDVATTEGEVAYRNSYAVEAGSPAVYEAEGPAARKVTAPPLAP